MKFNIQENNFTEKSIFPTKKAIISANKTLTWQEFYDETTKLVSVLKNLSLPKGHPVLIYGHKETNFIVAKTALMMLNLPYIPADVIFPLERIIMMQEESFAEVIINCTENKAINSTFNVVIELPSFRVKQNKKITFSLNEQLGSKSGIHYVLFTSGSTGRPKGVPIEKEGIDSFAYWLKTDFGLTEKDVFLNVSALSFDFASYEEYSFLELGASLVLTENETLKNSTKFIKSILDEEVSVWVSTPSLVFMYLMEPLFNGRDLPKIHTFVFAGENLPYKTVKKLMLLFPKARIINAFGPTEATNLTTKIELTQVLIDKYKAIPIGKAKPNSEILILNPDDEGIGEIVIVGNHVTPGYLNNDLLNAEKFYLHNGLKAYKSGDFGYFNDNLLFYSGRNDDMVKLHGYRIELEDITSKLIEIETVLNAATIGLKSNGDTKKIVSFVVTKNINLTSENLKNELKQHLPEYMIPSDIKFINELPLNSSAKVDKKMLLEIYLKK